MFNPAQLTIIRQGVDIDNYDGFVGIRHNKNGQTEFCLPFGFEQFSIENGDNITKLFFAFYRIFQQFQNTHKIESDKIKRTDTDGVIKATSKFTFLNKEEIPITLYSKLASIESILESYDELQIFSLVSRPRRIQSINYSRIDKYLHQAVFLKNHVPYIDEMILPEPVLEYSITDLVQMYCYVLWEIKRQLEEENVLPPEIINQAKIFHELNLQPDSALFSNNHEFTIQLLRSSLDDIHQQVSLKDDDYWHFYNALEGFLYGGLAPAINEEILWGITNFSSVWEDMCVLYFSKRNLWNEVWYADSIRFANKSIGGHRVYLDPFYETPFYLQLNSKKRYLRPDVVRLVKSQTTDEWFDEFFELQWISNYSCRIKLKDPQFIKLINALDKIIKSKVSGLKQKRKTSTLHTYTPITKLKMDQVIEDFKRGAKSTLSNRSYHIVVDFKYVNIDSYLKPKISSKIKHDIIKQMVYEYAINLNKPGNIGDAESQFCIPYYFPDEVLIPFEFVDDYTLNAEIQEQNIKILKLNFKKAQEVYLSSAINQQGYYEI